MPPDSPAADADVSYRALLRIPGLARVIGSMQLARIAGAMTGVALVLFTLLEYDSAPLAGIVTLASILPGLILSPIAGALLDRHGRVRLVQVDYLVAAAALVLVGALSLAGELPPWLLVLITAAASLTNPLSQTGLRSLFPIMVPRRLWERINAVDSNGYVIAIIVGPPVAALLLSALGPAAGLIVIAVPMAAASLILVGVHEPHTETVTTGNLLRDAWQGLVYVLRNPTLRGLGVGMTLNNFGNGMVSIILPLLVLDAIGGSELSVGIAFAVSGLTGIASAFLVGRMRLFGREQRMLWVSMLAMALPAALLLPGAAGWAGGLLAGYGLVLASQAIYGLFSGPLDVSMFTLRQRRTDPAWLGRAFAVSMAINFSGFPIGAAVAGALAEWSLVAAVALAVVAAIASGVASALLVPRADRPGEADAWRIRPAA